MAGSLTIGDSGVEFLPDRGSPLRWPLEEIHTLTLRRRRLVLTGYRNRRWPLHGDRSYRFDLRLAVPPSVAAALAVRVAKPVVNEVPDPSSPAFAVIPARHRTLRGGTNGTLRLGAAGIEYETETGKDGRNWRWADIDTLANPDPWRLTVTGYRETFDFELKEPISRALFDRLWDLRYAPDFTTAVGDGEDQHP